MDIANATHEQLVIRPRSSAAQETNDGLAILLDHSHGLLVSGVFFNIGFTRTNYLLVRLLLVELTHLLHLLLGQPLAARRLTSHRLRQRTHALHGAIDLFIS